MTTTVTDLTYHTAPEDQGQTIEIAYAAEWEHERIIRRITDRSDGSVRYEAISAAYLRGDFEPWTAPPEFSADAWHSVGQRNF